MIAAYGLQWFDSFDDCVAQFIDVEHIYEPNLQRHQQYESLQYL